MSFHSLFGRHSVDPRGNRWENGLFVGNCRVCQEPMVKSPGKEWRLAGKAIPR
jgi:hypothetical protein